MVRRVRGLRWITGLAAGAVAATISGHAALTTVHGDDHGVVQPTVRAESHGLSAQ